MKRLTATWSNYSLECRLEQAGRSMQLVEL